ncbi:MAG TPA: DUF378 domain-containing protein [Candidatus Limnocylindria bacterium]
MRAAQILASILLIVGGLNWGLVAIANFDLVAALVGLTFGNTNAITRVIYGMVGAAAVFEAVRLVTVRSARTALA